MEQENWVIRKLQTLPSPLKGSADKQEYLHSWEQLVFIQRLSNKSGQPSRNRRGGRKDFLNYEKCLCKMWYTFFWWTWLSIIVIDWHQSVESHRTIDFFSQSIIGSKASLGSISLWLGRLDPREVKGLIQSHTAHLQQSWEQNTFPLPSQCTSLHHICFLCSLQVRVQCSEGVLSTISRWLFLTLLFLVPLVS